jgi:predicted nucleotidyltransferase
VGGVLRNLVVEDLLEMDKDYNDIRDNLNRNSIVQYIKKNIHDVDVYVCGGYLRSIIARKSPNSDIDIFVDCTPEQLNRLLRSLSPLGRIEFGQYGSPRLFTDNSSEKYIDIVPFYNFIVGDKKITSIEMLLRNFDFTANAVGWNIGTSELYNPVGGIDDVRHKILRAVRYDFPEKMVSPDVQISAVSVFWFRLLHYQCVLNYEFDGKTLEWITDNVWRWRDRDKFEQYFYTPLISEKIRKKLFL